MQKLHLVGFTADQDGLIFSTRKGAKSGNFVVPVDARLLKQIAELEKEREGSSKDDEHRIASPRLERPESALSPREMQDRIRAGWTLDEVAAEAGVDLDWVRRFASPVLAEVRRVLEDARQAYYDKPRFGLSTLPLGPAVRRNVLERGVRMTDEELDDCWTAYQLDDDLWVVRFMYVSRGREQEAEWRYDLETEELTSRNRLAAQLGFVTKSRPKKASTAVPVKPAKPSPKVVKEYKAAQAAKTAPAAPAPAPVTNGTGARRRASGAKKRASSTKKASKKRARAPVERETPPTAPARRTREDAPPWRPTLVAAPKPTPAPVVRPAPPPIARPSPSPPPAEPRPTAPPPRPEPRVQESPPPPPPPRRHAPPAPPPPPPPPPPRRAAEPPPRPGPTDVDPDTGIAHIDSRRMWHDVPAQRAAFRDVTFANDQTPPPPSKPPRPRRNEPLRARAVGSASDQAQ